MATDKERRDGDQGGVPEAVGKVAIVTGGSRGIGRAVVEALLGAGYRVYFGSRSRESVDQALAELRPRHGAAIAGRPLDVRRQDQVDAFAEWVLAEAGRLDCLVNNAGMGAFGPVYGLSGDQWREVIETNLNGAFYCIRAVAGTMKDQGSGWILNIASLAGKNAMVGGAAYNASKYGLLGLSEAAMLDLRQFGVRVATILPGSVDTSFGSPAKPRGDRSWMLAPEDVAAMVLHLLSYPERALPSHVEMRPTRPPRK
ncbi:MAG TPA: SDR family oxidoreductase [Thermoanaerobaculia bacterium]|jgi:NAD(P)-dependent dehydrogenase (short-subunit alcohol dehydrogenase family)|nr:SDR family oxidoreductase [Thermoanaerobaculia bacterium]